MKKFFSLIILLSFLSSNCAFADMDYVAKQGNQTEYVDEQEYSEKSNRLFHGHAEKNENIKRDDKELFTGELEDFGDTRRDFINMTVSQVLSTGYTEEGDEFFAEVTSDVMGDKGVILPVGTIAHGKVREITGGKRLNRNGWIELTFDSLITPDGREIPIEGKMTTKSNLATSIAKGVGRSTVHTVGGGVVGGYVALNLLGLEAAIASQGYTILGGVALGGAIGLGISLLKKGKDAMLSPGDEIKVKLTSKVTLPVLSEEALKQEEIFYEGLNVKITNLSLEEDPFGEENTYGLNLVINNATEKSFSSMDIAVASETNNIFYPSIFGDNTLMFKVINPNDRVAGKLSFAVTNPKKKHWLVFYDRQTRKPIAKISIDNAKRRLEAEQKNKKKRKKNK